MSILYSIKCLILVVVCCCCVQAVPKEALLSGAFIAGEKAHDNQFPYLASIRIKAVHYCAGAILNTKWILTAAHCKTSVLLADYTVIVGTNRLNSGGETYAIAQFLQHDQFNAITHDIALIQLANALHYATSINAIQLPIYDIDDNEYVIASGWGYTNAPYTTPNDVMWLYLMTLNSDICRGKYRKQQQTVNLNGSHLCTYKRKGYALCSIDSGGPITANGIIYGIALSSWSHSCSLREHPNIFTNVHAHRQWILKRIIY